MEIGEEFMGSNDLTQIVKGRRTKRHRSSSPYKAAVAPASSSSSGCGGGGGGGEEEVVVEEYNSVFSSTTTSSDVYESTEEEEDLANCLILLAQGDGPRKVGKFATTTTTNINASSIIKLEKFTTQKFSDFTTSTATTNKAGYYVYECKTCNRSFPSFQALGGHRASHKKPRPTTEEKKPAPNMPVVVASIGDINIDECSVNKNSCPLPDLVSLQIAPNNVNSNKVSPGSNNKVNKVHECSICGSEFSSGQALGGHMRRHRANTGNSNQVALSGIEASPATNTNDQDHEMIKPRNVLPLDLNLPAPEDDHYHHHHRQPKFEFVSTQQALVFSAPALVDCHY